VRRLAAAAGHANNIRFPPPRRPSSQDTHRHQKAPQVLPRLARRGLTCSRSVTWQQCQGTVVHAESHLAHPGRALQQIAPLNIFTSLRLVTARAPKRSEATFPPRSPPARCLVRAPLQRMAAGAHAPLPYQLHRRPQARPSASASVSSTCCPTYYCVPVCSVILTRRGYPDQPAQCAIVAAHTH
jgi:hypothetical protein